MALTSDSRTYITSSGLYHCNTLVEGIGDDSVDKSSASKYMGVGEICEVDIYHYNGKFTSSNAFSIIVSELGVDAASVSDSPVECRGYCRIVKGSDITEGVITQYQMNPESTEAGGIHVTLNGADSKKIVLYVESSSTGEKTFSVNDELQGYINVNGAVIVSSNKYNTFINKSNMMYVQDIEEFYEEG